MSKIEELTDRVEKLERMITHLEQWDTLITLLDEFTTDDKVRIFDKLYAQAREYLRKYVKNGHEPMDGDYYIYETVLSEMLGDEVWSIIRAIGT